MWSTSPFYVGIESDFLLFDLWVHKVQWLIHFCFWQICGGKATEGIFVGAFLSMSSTTVVFLLIFELNFSCGRV